MSATKTSGWDPAWEEVFKKQEWGKYPPEHVIRFVARNWYKAADRKSVALLDLGCGPGAVTWYMAREGFAVRAIDGSRTAIERLRARLAQEGLTADARAGDYLALPWADASCDGAVDNVSLCCNSFESCRRAVAEVYRVLKPGGRFQSANFTPRTWGFGLGRKSGPNQFTDIAEGPLAGKGFCLFMDDAQAAELYGDFADTATDFLSYTLAGGAHSVELRIVECRKPS